MKFVNICPVWLLVQISYHQELRYCSSCREGIYGGERYIENDFGEYIHEDCIKDIKQLLKWLGYTVEIMEDTNEKQTN